MEAFDFQDNWEFGDPESGNPQGGPEGLDQPEIVNTDPTKAPRMWQVFDIVALAQGQPVTCPADSRPDWWIITLDATATTAVSLYQGRGAGGIPQRFGPKGYAVIPAQSTEYAITLLSTAAATPNITVIAARGFHLQATYRRES